MNNLSIALRFQLNFRDFRNLSRPNTQMRLSKKSGNDKTYTVLMALKEKQQILPPGEKENSVALRINFLKIG